MATALVSAYWLRRRFVEGLNNIRIIDASWDLVRGSEDAREHFSHTRIERASFFDLDGVSDKSSPYSHMLPTPQQFQDYIGQMGIGNSHRVVVYDNNKKFGLFSAPRVWWMFKVFGHKAVSVLDGGLPHWMGCGYPIEQGPPPQQPLTWQPYSASYDAELVRSKEEVEKCLKSGYSQVADARSEGRFMGHDPEPRPHIPSGHMIGAKNIPYMTLLDSETKLLKNKEQLRQVFKGAGVDLSLPMLTTCGSGVTAAILSFAAHLLHVTAPLYDGSWEEWVQAASPSSRTMLTTDVKK